MNAQTKKSVVALIRADDSVEARERMRLIALLNDGPRTEPQARPGPCIYQRREASRLTGRSLRWIDSVCRRGLVRRVKLVGSKRAIGLRADDLDRLIEASTVAVCGGKVGAL